MSNKLPNVGSSANSDEQSYAEYIGTGEAHYVPPAMKKPKFMEIVEPEPKSIDVFANSEPGSQESSQESSNGYETCPEEGMETSMEEGAGPEEEKEAEPTPRRKLEELGSKTIRFSPEIQKKIEKKSPFYTQNAQRSMEKRMQLELQTRGISAQNSPILSQNEPKNTPKSVQKNLYPIFLAQNSPKSVKNEQNFAQKTPNSTQNAPKLAEKHPFSAQKTPNSAQKHPFLPQKTPNSARNSPFSAQQTPISAQKSIKTPGSTTSSIPYFTPLQHSKTPQKAGRSIEQAGKTLRRSLFDEDPVPRVVEDSPLKRDSEGSEEVKKEEDGSMEERKKSRRSMVDARRLSNSSDGSLVEQKNPSDDSDDETVEDMVNQSRNPNRMEEKSPTVTYGPLNNSPKGPQVKKEQTPYQYTHHPADEALEEEDDDDDEYFKPIPKPKRAPSSEPEEDDDFEDEEDFVEMETDESGEQRAQAGTEAQESPEYRPVFRKRSRIDSSSDQTSDSTPERPKQQEERTDRYRQQFLKNQEEFQNEEVEFKPNLEKDKTDHNPIYCKIRGLPVRENVQRPVDGRFSSILNQLWSQTDDRDNGNAYYQYQQAYLKNWLKERRSNGSCYQLFVGLIHDMMGIRPTTMWALDRYYYRKLKETSKEEVMEQFERVVRLALQAEEILPRHIYLLTGDVRSATLSHKQCAALVARMFFNKKRLKYGSPETLNFLDILSGTEQFFVEKLYFLFAYTDKMYTSPPEGVVSFRRCFADEATRHEAFKRRKEEKLPVVQFLDNMNIEETALCSQVDFANKRIGGGVLGYGFVQEEIRFLMCPEMLVSMMLLPRDMWNNESFSIVGAYVFSSYDGYGQHTKWRELQPKHARQNDESLRDRFGRLRVETIAIDALQFDTYRSKMTILRNQLQWENVRREVFKAWQGFSGQTFRFKNIPVVSGWWGCGAFGGNKALKFIVQLIAAGIANRPLHICTFGDVATSEKCQKFLKFLNERQITCGILLGLLNKLSTEYMQYTDCLVFDVISQMIRSQERGLAGR